MMWIFLRNEIVFVWRGDVGRFLDKRSGGNE